MNLFNVIKVGGQSLFVMLFTLSASLLTAFFMGKALKLHRNMTTLIGVVTSICGGSAIAATAPVIQAEDEDVAHAISTIFLFNIVAVFIFPALGHIFGMSDIGFGMWAGTAINVKLLFRYAPILWSAGQTHHSPLVTHHSYFTSIRHKPWGGTVGPASALLPDSTKRLTSSGLSFPFPT